MAPPKRLNIKDRAAEAIRDGRTNTELHIEVEEAIRDAVKFSRADILERARAKARLYGNSTSTTALNSLIADLEKLPPP